MDLTVVVLLPPGSVLVEEMTVVLIEPGFVVVLLDVTTVVDAAEEFELIVLVETIVETLVVGETYVEDVVLTVELELFLGLTLVEVITVVLIEPGSVVVELDVTTVVDVQFACFPTTTVFVPLSPFCVPVLV